MARLLQYFSLGEATTLGVGVSAARRDEGTGAFRDLGGVDLYLRWRPLQGRSYLALQGELYAPEVPERHRGGSDAGGYAQLFWRQGAYSATACATTRRRRRWRRARGRSAATASSPPGSRASSSASGSRSPATSARAAPAGLEAILELEFGIGAHGAHPF